MESYLEIKNFSLKAYETEDFYLWKDLNLNLKSGQIISILGSNGSGKTSLFKAILTREFSSSKSDLSCIFIHRALAYLSSENKVAFSLLVRDIILSGRLQNKGLFSQPNETDWQAIKKILKDFDLMHYEYKNFNELSSGEKQKVLIARAFATGADIFLLDEMDNHLDFQHQKFFLSWILKMKEQGKSILMISHNPNYAHRVSDFILYCYPVLSEHELRLKEKTTHKLKKIEEPCLFSKDLSDLYKNAMVDLYTPKQMGILPQFLLKDRLS